MKRALIIAIPLIVMAIMGAASLSFADTSSKDAGKSAIQANCGAQSCAEMKGCCLSDDGCKCACCDNCKDGCKCTDCSCGCCKDKQASFGSKYKVNQVTKFFRAYGNNGDNCCKCCGSDGDQCCSICKCDDCKCDSSKSGCGSKGCSSESTAKCCGKM